MKKQKTHQEVKKKVAETVGYYAHMQQTRPNSSIIREVKEQYADMAQGGDGGRSWEKSSEEEDETIRESYYPGYPDEFFAEVCDLLGWSREQDSNQQ